jgi:hypothetical protein
MNQECRRAGIDSASLIGFLVSLSRFPGICLEEMRRRRLSSFRSELWDEARDQGANELRELGLGHEVVGARLHCGVAMFIQTEPGSDDHGRGFVQTFDLLKERDALHAGGQQAFKHQVPIQNQNIGREFLTPDQRVGT